MHQVSRTVDSITLSWSQPDQPNGVILDYELQYYEKVTVSCPPAPGPNSPRVPLPVSAWCPLSRQPQGRAAWRSIGSTVPTVRSWAGALSSVSLAALVQGAS